MKITLAFYGIPRHTPISAPSIERNLLGPLREVGAVTVVHHLWRIDRISNVRSGENAEMQEDAYDYFKKFPGRVEPAEPFEKSEEFASWKSLGDAFLDDFGSLRNLMHQLQSLKRVTQEVRYTRPDIVVFARPDLQYHDAIPLSACRFMAQRPSCCAVPIWNWWSGYNDRFAICGRDAFEPYGFRIDQAIAFARRTAHPIHSERLLRFALRQAHIQILGIPLRASRVRLNGEVKQENFDSIGTSGRERIERLRCRATRSVSKMLFGDTCW